MNKFLIIIFIIMLSGTVHLNAQEHRLSIKIAKAGFAHPRVKDLLQSVRRSAIVNATVTDAFPSYYNFEVQFDKRIKPNFSLGILGGYNSTAGRIYYADYSGFYRHDQLLQSRFAGVSANYHVFDKFPKVLLFMNVSYVFSSISVEDELSTDNDYTIERLEFKSKGFNFEPGVQVTIPIKFLDIGLYASGLWNISESFRSPINKNQIIVNGNEQVNPNWTGTRYGIVTSLNF